MANPTMFGRLVCITVALTSLFEANSQVLTHRSATNPPSVQWSKPMSSAAENRNGAFVSPQEEKVFAIVNNGEVAGFETGSGNDLWREFVDASSPGKVVSGCESGITFAYDNANGIEDYLVFSVIELDTATNEQFTRVIGRRISDGSVLFASEPLPGVGNTPQASADGRHVAITHNSGDDQSIGHFSLIDILRPNVTSTLIPPIFTQEDPINPFGEIGVKFAPSRPIYVDTTGNNTHFNNNNDMFVFAYKARDSGDGILADNARGQMFVVQLPNAYRFDGLGIFLIPAGNANRFQATERPVFFGDDVYWHVERAGFYAWFDNARLDERWNAELTAARGLPAYLAGRAPPTVIEVSGEVGVYFSLAENGFGYAPGDYSSIQIFRTAFPVWSRPVVSPDHAFVYAATENGLLYQFSAKGALVPGFTESLFWLRIFGDLAIKADGGIVYVVDSDSTSRIGKIVALRVADVATAAPTSAPSSAPSVSPSTIPTVSNAPSSGTPMPTTSPTFAPTAEPTPSPTAEPTPMPTSEPTPIPPPSATSMPTSSPTARPTNAPTLPPTEGSGASAAVSLFGLSLLVIAGIML